MNDKVETPPSLEQPRLEPNQFDLMTLMLLPVLFIYGFILAYAVRHWSFHVAVGSFNYFPQFVLQVVPRGFATVLYDLPGIACLYLIIIMLAACRARLANLAIGVLLIDWIAVLLFGTFDSPVSWQTVSLDTLGSFILALASAIPFALGRALRAYWSDRTQLWWHRVVGVAMILIVPVAIWGYYSPVQP